MPSRVYTQRERRLLSEWLALYKAGARIIVNPRLGSAPIRTAAPAGSANPSQIQQNAMMYADAVVIYPDRAELYEAKIFLDGRAIGQLLEYQVALPASPDFIEWRGLPLTLHVVAATARATTLTLCDRLRIAVHLYTPGWVVENFAAWFGAQSRPLQPASGAITA